MNSKNEADPQPMLYNVTIRPDLPPEVELLDPRRDLEMPANGILPLMIRARDPDFLLRSVKLQVEKDGEHIASEDIFDGFQNGFQKSFSTRPSYDFRLKQRGLMPEPGEIITYWIEARDNKQPKENRTNTPRLKIRIVDPVSDEQAEKQLSQDKQRQLDMLEERRRQENTAGEHPAEQVENRDPQQDGAGEAQAAEPQAEADEGESQQQTAGRQEGDNQTSQSDRESSEPQRREFSKDGQDDQDILQQLIEREQEEQSKNEKLGEESKPNKQDAEQNDANKHESGAIGSDDATGKKDGDGQGNSKGDPTDKNW